MQNHSEIPHDFNMLKAMELAGTPAGQQLLSLLQQSSGEELRTAMEKAASGDYASARQALAGMLSDPEVQKLLRQLGR